MSLKSDHLFAKRSWVILAVLSMACLRVIFAYHLSLTMQAAQARVGDERYYLKIATEILDHHSFKEGNLVAYRPPLFPAFASLAMAGAGRELWLLQLAQNILFACSVFTIAYIVLKTYGAFAAIFCAAVLTINPVWIVLPQLALSETLFTFLLATSIFTAFHLICRPAVLLAIALGIVIGLSALTREIGLYLGIALLFCLFLKRLLSTRYVLISALAIAVVILPWTIRNYERLGGFVLVTTNGPINLYMGNNPGANGTMHWALPADAAIWNQPGTELRVYRTAGSAAVRYISSHWERTLALWPVKLQYLWGPIPVLAPQSKMEAIYGFARYGFWIVYGAAALCGLAIDRKSWFSGIVIGWVLTASAIHLWTYSQPIYRAPYDFFFAVPASIAFLRGVRTIRAAFAFGRSRNMVANGVATQP